MIRAGVAAIAVLLLFAAALIPAVYYASEAACFARSRPLGLPVDYSLAGGCRIHPGDAGFPTTVTLEQYVDWLNGGTA